MDFSEWRDADFYSLPSQTTIHSLASLKTEKDTSKFLVSSMNCQFCSVEYQIAEKITPVMKNVQFSNLPMPGDAEVVAISVFERLPPKQGHVVGITYVIFDKQTNPEQTETLPKSQAFNMYSAIVDEEQDEASRVEQLKLEVIAENCQSISLPYIPFFLKNTVVQTKNGVPEPVFLISGSDFKIHLYREDAGQQPTIGEIPAVTLFPEFENLPGIAETIEIATPDPQHRVTAIGFEEGQIEVFKVNLQTLDIVKVWKTSMDAPITSLHFFTHRKIVPVPPCFEGYVDENGPGGRREEEEDPDFTHLHLLMTVHLQPALVYRNVLNNGLSEVLTLPDSDKFDSALCSLALDVDFDGEHEVIVGTYGQELLVYKFFPTMEKQVPLTASERDMSTSPPSASGGAVGGSSSRRVTVSGLSPTEESSKHRHNSEEGNTQEKTQHQQRKVKSQEDLMSMLTRERGIDAAAGGQAAAQAPGGMEGGGKEVLRTVPEPHYRLQWRRSFPCPIMALGGGDMMGDGVENLVVLTSSGIHILQPNIHKLMDLVTHRLKEMRDSVHAQDVGDEFHKLQIE
ncbi:KICSTOR complex protein kaptin-like [Babylonia areolata]|uniref:KICSTOR complex protein kaptin-like n=1 Tax=Babylonia areolata TaxID=304850 RepID=UPI003FD28800